VSNPAFPDIGNLWRDLLRQWEDAGNAIGTDAMKSAEFSKLMNQASTSSAALQRAFADLSAKYLAVINLPTAADVKAIGDKVQALEGRIEEIHLMLADGKPQGASGQGYIKPTRNRQPPAPPSPRPVSDGQS